jgi:nucleotide-binding universal stress UspA family protein
MSAFRYILAPLDFSSKSERTLQAVKQLATPGETRVCLMHVVEAGPHADDDRLIAFYKSLEESARQKIAASSVPLRELGLEVTECVATGRPARLIIDEAQRSGADLLVLSSHPLGEGVQDVHHWATVSYQVAIFCRCPVLLVK